MKARHGTLSAGAETTVSLVHEGADFVVVHIDKGATGPIFVTVDGTTITAVDQNDTVKVQSVGDHARTLQIPTATATAIDVKLFSATADGYTVEVF